jgi:phenylacetate-CoA ligase
MSTALARAYAAHALWSRSDLGRFQNERLRRLLRHAVARSAFYRRLYRGLDLDAPLAALPVVTRDEMMAHFDRFVTDPRLKLRELRAHLDGLKGDDLHLGEYRVLASSGSGGAPGVFVFDRREWNTVLAAGSRAGGARRAGARGKTAYVVSPKPCHVSRRAGFSAAGDSLFLDATADAAELVSALNAFQPETLVGYATLVAILAEEQAAKRLNIRPRAIRVGAELLTGRMARRMRESWGVEPSQVYGLTECSCLAASCPDGGGLHAFEDLGLIEAVDERDRPVPDGATGARILLTNLYNYTQPLIRYEVSDLVTIARRRCPCGSPFRLIARIAGREEEILYLRSLRGGETAVPPAQFRFALEKFRAIADYRIVLEAGGLDLTLVARAGASRTAVASAVARELDSRWRRLGVAAPELRVRFAAGIPRDATGKAKRIRSNVPRPRSS